MIVTIDGPAAAGKSTVAKSLAKRLEFDFLDTGALYRTVTLAAVRSRIPLDDETALGKLAASIRIAFQGGAVLLDGEDVSAAIRDATVTKSVRHVADAPIVRQHMTRLQRSVAQGRNIVTEGRDQGTVVFPDAECKFFLDARPEIRAARRQLENVNRGQATSLEQVLADQTERDRGDASRTIAPMLPAPDSIVVDSSDLDFDQVVAQLEKLVRARLGGPPSAT